MRRLTIPFLLLTLSVYGCKSDDKKTTSDGGSDAKVMDTAKAEVTPDTATPDTATTDLATSETAPADTGASDGAPADGATPDSAADVTTD